MTDIERHAAQSHCGRTNMMFAAFADAMLGGYEFWPCSSFGEGGEFSRILQWKSQRVDFHRMSVDALCEVQCEGEGGIFEMVPCRRCADFGAERTNS